MNKLGNIFQIAYIVFACVFLYEGVAQWSVNRSMSYILFAAAAMAIFKFFFNKKYRKRFEDHYKKRDEQKRNAKK